MGPKSSSGVKKASQQNGEALSLHPLHQTVQQQALRSPGRPNQQRMLLSNQSGQNDINLFFSLDQSCGELLAGSQELLLDGTDIRAEQLHKLSSVESGKVGISGRGRKCQS